MNLLDKQALRTQALTKRKAIDAVYAETAAQTLAQNILHYIKSGTHVISGYAATRGEINLFPALSLLAEEGHKLCMPVIEEKGAPLVFREWKPGAKMIKGMYDIDIPESGALLIPSIVLTPLVAFDSTGNRLGYGGGYYDRTIAKLRKENTVTQVIGIAYAAQQLEHIPAEPKDMKLDFIITEKWVIGNE